MRASAIGIVAALPEEADAFMDGFGIAQTGPVPIRRIERNGETILVATSGIGKVNAATAATVLAVDGCELLLVIGTAGLIAPRSEMCFWLGEAVQHDYGAERPGRFVHYTAGAIPIGAAPVEAFKAVSDPGLGLPHARIASGDAFIECPDHARFLAEGLSADLVDMETAAVAQVAARFGLAWAAIKAVTDEANGQSAGSFRDNLARAARLAAAAAERFVGFARP
jgi:adenosylhomocysteine nucleosidase